MFFFFKGYEFSFMKKVKLAFLFKRILNVAVPCVFGLILRFPVYSKRRQKSRMSPGKWHSKKSVTLWLLTQVFIYDDFFPVSCFSYDTYNFNNFPYCNFIKSIQCLFFIDVSEIYTIYISCRKETFCNIKTFKTDRHFLIVITSRPTYY